MRLDHIYSSLLLEHNVVNQDEIHSYVSRFASRLGDHNTRQWFEQKIGKFLEKSEEFNATADVRLITNPPHWLKDAIERGDDVRKFTPTARLSAQLEHLVDYLNALVTLEPNFVNDQKRLMAMTVDHAIMRADRWVASDAKKASKKASGKFEELQKFPGGFYMMQSDDLDTIHRDGAILQNCLGQGHYDQEIKGGDYKVFFLRDRNDQPHVAISYTFYRGINEIKGKNNKPPIQRYAEMVVDFLNKQESWAGKNCADVRAMGYTCNQDGKIVSMDEAAEVVFTMGDIFIKFVPGADNENWVYRTGNENVLMKFRVSGSHPYVNTVDPSVDKDKDFVRAVCAFANQQNLIPQKEGDYSRRNGGSQMFPYDYRTKQFGIPEEICESAGEIDGEKVYLHQPEDNPTTYWCCGDVMISIDGRTEGTYLFRNFPSRDEPTEELGSLLLKVANLLPLHIVMIDQQYVRDNPNSRRFRRDGTFGPAEEKAEITWSEGKLAVGYLPENYAVMLKKGKILALYRVKKDDLFKIAGEDEGIETDLSSLLLSDKNFAEYFERSYDRLLSWGLGHTEEGQMVRAKDIEETAMEFGDGAILKKFLLSSKEARSEVYGIDYYEGGALVFRGHATASLSKKLNFVDVDLKKQPKPTNMIALDKKISIGDKLGMELGLTHEYASERRVIIECNPYFENKDFNLFRLNRRIYICEKSGKCVGYFTIADGLIKSIVSLINDGRGDKRTYQLLADLCEKQDLSAESNDFKGKAYSFYQDMLKGGFWLRPMQSSFHETFKISAIGDDMTSGKVCSVGKTTWWKEPYCVFRGDDPSENGYTLKDKKAYVARFVLNDDLTIDHRQSHNIKECSPEEIAAILTKTKANINLVEATSYLVFRTKSGAYRSMIGTPLQQFADGKITFPDGSTFTRTRREERDNEGRVESTYFEWQLRSAENDAYAVVRVDETGLDSVKYNRRARTEPKFIMKHIQVLLTMLDKVMGN